MMSIQRQRIKASLHNGYLRNSRLKSDKIFSKKNILLTQDDSNRKLNPRIRYERNGNFDVLIGEIEDTSDYKKIADVEELFLGYGSEIHVVLLITA